MRPGLISSLVTAVTMRLSNPRGSVAAGGRRLESSSTSTATFFPPKNVRQISTAASPSAPPSPTRDGGASASSKGGPLRSSHPLDYHQQQQRGLAAAAAAASASAASAVADVAQLDDVDRLLPAQPPPPLRVSFASFPRFETAFPNALSSRRRMLDEASRMSGSKKEKEQLAPIADDKIIEEEPALSTSTSTSSSSTTLAAAPHDSKLALFFNVYGPRPTAAAGRGESARAARDALALFHAVYGPPRHLQQLEEEDEIKEVSSSSSLSPLRRAAAAAAADAASSPATSSSSSPRTTTKIALPEVSLSSSSSASSSSSTARRRLSFSRSLSRGVVLERPNRFTMRVQLLESGEVISCHCPVTGALGGLGMGAFEGAGAPCLVSRVADEDEGNDEIEADSGTKKRAKKYYARKTPFTVEAVSLADPRGPPSWVGINQMAANRYIEHFWNAGALPELSSSSSSPSAVASAADDEGSGASLVRETRIRDTRSRLDFAAAGGRDLVEVKCPLDALPLLRDCNEESSSSSSSTKLKPNPVLAAAAALRAQTAGERLARLPRAKRAAMYERAARHAGVLAEHLATAKRRERAAAARARRRARAAEKRRSKAAAEEVSDPSSVQQQALTLASLEEDDDEDLFEEELSEPRARALLIQCFQFAAPPVRGMLPPPEGADPSLDGRAAVAAAMRSAARAGVETWQVNMRFDESGVELLDCFKLDLFSSEAASAAASSSSAVSSSNSLKKEQKKEKSSKKTSSSVAVAATAAAATTAAAAAPLSTSRFERFSSFSPPSSSSSSGDESDDGGALFAA